MAKQHSLKQGRQHVLSMEGVQHENGCIRREAWREQHRQVFFFVKIFRRVFLSRRRGALGGTMFQRRNRALNEDRAASADAAPNAGMAASRRRASIAKGRTVRIRPASRKDSKRGWGTQRQHGSITTCQHHDKRPS
eukprot:361569-Chlamydomonas_euryale.AAC.6